MQVKVVTAFVLILAGNFALAQEPERVGSWGLTCEGDICQAFLNVASDDDVVLSWSLLNSGAENGATSIIRLPLGAALPPGLRILTGDGEGYPGAFQVCEADGCSSVVPMPAEMIADIGSRETVRVAFFRYGGSQPVAIEVPVDGFEAALAALID